MKHMQGKILSNPPILLLLINAGLMETGLKITMYRQYLNIQPVFGSPRMNTILSLART